MTRPIQHRPCRQLSVAMDDDLFELIDLAFTSDEGFSSRADVARALMWAGAGVLLAAAADPLDEGATVPLRDVVPAGAA